MLTNLSWLHSCLEHLLRNQKFEEASYIRRVINFNPNYHGALPPFNTTLFRFYDQESYSGFLKQEINSVFYDEIIYEFYNQEFPRQSQSDLSEISKPYVSYLDRKNKIEDILS